jgi:excisionase family DNA binding protein
MPGITVDNVYETAEAAQLIGIGYATLYRWIKAGKLTPIRIAGRTLIPKSEVDRLRRERNAKARERSNPGGSD